VIYTSGSSGRPKGVMLDHRGRVNNIEDYCRTFGMGPDDRTLCVSSLSFDISVCDLFCSLNAGGVFVLPEPARAKDPDHWLDLVEREGITLWHSAPALMDALLDVTEERGPRPGTLRLTVLDGDWIPLTQPDRVRASFPAARVVSAGAATELSVDSVTYPVGAVDPASRVARAARPAPQLDSVDRARPGPRPHPCCPGRQRGRRHRAVRRLRPVPRRRRRPRLAEHPVRQAHGQPDRVHRGRADGAGA